MLSKKLRETIARATLWLVPIISFIPIPAAANLLEEVIVTAKKREESLQDVSVSVTAFSSETMREIGLTNSNDLGQYTPGVEIAAVNGNQTAKTWIRGSGSIDFNANANTTVGVYADEVYITNIFAHTLHTFDLERIEVLRGPQGTLYGRNATAGAINYIAAKPQQEFGGYATASYGNYDALKLEGAVTGGITEELAGRFSFTYENDDGWMKNRLTGASDLNDADVYAWRGQILWQPQDSVDILFKVHGSQNNSKGFSNQHTGAVDPVTFGPCDATERNDCVDFFAYIDPDGIEERGDPTQGDFDLVGPADYETLGGVIRVDWELQNFTVTSITAYDKFARKNDEDADGSPNVISHNFYQHSADGWSQELRLTSTSDGPWDWILGFYYAEDELDSTNQYVFFGFNTFQFYEQEQDSIAAFANLGYQLNDQFKLTAGLRYTEDNVELSHRSDDDFGPFDPGSSGSPSFSDLSWKFGLDYTPNDDWLLYASISKGYKSGGVGVGFGDPAVVSEYDEETLIAYEIGFKSTLWDGKAQLNASGFYYDYSDLQVFDQTVGAFGLTFLIGNASEAEYYGSELELIISPIDRLDLLFGLSYLSTEFEEFLRPLSGADLSGNDNVYAPEWKFTGLIRYEWPTPQLFDGKIVASFNWSWTDEVFHSVENLNDIRGKAHWLAGGRLSYKTSDERFEISLWGKNLADTAYRVQTFDFRSAGFNTSVPNRPRTYGVEVAYHW